MSDITTGEDDRITVYLGNHNAVELLDDPADATASLLEHRAPATIRRPVPGKQCTIVKLEPGLSLMDAAAILTHTTQGVWQAHSDAAAPAWVASDWDALAQLLAAHWGGIEVRAPQHELHNANVGAEG